MRCGSDAAYYARTRATRGNDRGRPAPHRRHRVKPWITSGVLVVGVAMTVTAGAQVGYPPARSPYIDIPMSQELTLLLGHYAAKRDPAGVAPQSGTLVGAHYEWRASGPAHLTAELARVSSMRRLIDPAK